MSLRSSLLAEGLRVLPALRLRVARRVQFPVSPSVSAEHPQPPSQIVTRTPSIPEANNNTAGALVRAALSVLLPHLPEARSRKPRSFAPYPALLCVWAVAVEECLCAAPPPPLSSGRRSTLPPTTRAAAAAARRDPHPAAFFPTLRR